MLGEERWKFVHIDHVKMKGLDADKNGQVTKLTISQDDVAKFSAIGGNLDEREFSRGMGRILSQSYIAVEFRIADEFKDKDGNKQSVNDSGITIRSGDSRTGNIQIFVRNDAVEMANQKAQEEFDKTGRTKGDDGKPLQVHDISVIDAHEHGHAYAFSLGLRADSGDSVTFENAVRSRNPAYTQKRTIE